MRILLNGENYALQNTSRQNFPRRKPGDDDRGQEATMRRNGKSTLVAEGGRGAADNDIEDVRFRLFTLRRSLALAFS